MKNEITIKKINTFPSMEYGEDGGLECDVYFKNKKVGHFIQFGNGGTFDFYKDPNSKISENDLNEYSKDFFKRNEVARHMIGYNDPKLIDVLDLEEMVNFLVDYNTFIKKDFNKKIKLGYKYFIHVIKKCTSINDVPQSFILTTRSVPVTKEILDRYAKKHKYDNYFPIYYTSLKEYQNFFN